MSTITLQSCDGEVFHVDKTIAMKLKTVKTLLEDLGDEDDEAIPLPNVSSDILKRVIQWAEHHINDPEDDDDEKKAPPVEIPPWDADFLNASLNTLVDINMSANFLEIRGLLNLTFRFFANMIIGKTPEEIRQTFYLEDDLTEAENEQIMKENAWLEE